MKKIVLVTILIGLFLMVTAFSSISATQQEEGSDIAEEKSTEDMNSAEFDPMIVVSGLIAVIDSDADGNPDQVTVQNHIISEYGRGLDLFDYVGQMVKINGEFFDDGNGKVLDVISYELLEDSSVK